MRRVVVKLGGSTAAGAELRVWIAALAGSSLALVIVPGGGPFANLVRDTQKRMDFSEEAAHAMAILAMDQFGHVILDGQERFAPAHSLDEMEQTLAEGRTPVWLPSRLSLAAPDIRASWDITSDSLAAWLAGKLGAEALLLVKQSSDFSAADDIDSLTAREIVDAGFSTMLPKAMELFLAGPRDAATAGAMLITGRLPGVRISAAAAQRRVG